MAAIQESKLQPSSPDITFQGYTLLRCDRDPPNGGGGLAYLIHDSIPFTHIDTSDISDGTTEIQAISTTLNQSPIDLYNIYIPPASSCPPDYNLSDTTLTNLFNRSDNDTIVMGDFNAHHMAWNSHTTCDKARQRGETILDAINDSNLVLLNTEQHTRLPSNGLSSSPDLTLISAHLAPDTTWQTHTQLNSDHVPISITFDNDNPPTRRKKTYTNFRLADWDAFQAKTERLFSTARDPTSTTEGVKTFNRIINKTSNKTIPTGHRKNCRPGLSPELRRLISDRDRLRQQDHNDPTLPDLNRQITQRTQDEALKTWTEHVTSCNHTTNPSKFFRLLRSLSGKSTNPPPNQPINFDNKPYTKASAIASRFTKQFTCIKTHRQDPATRKIYRKIHKRHKLDPDFRPFNERQVQEAIKTASNSTATGPDDMSNLHLKHLGPSGISYLCKIFNLSISSACLPALWKHAIIIPLLKAGKPADQSKSYRPISLLCPASKILEKLLLPFLTSSLPTDPSQHGFKAKHSTTTALLPLSTSIAIGFNQNKPASRTAAVAIDYAKAFDSVDHPTLLLKLCNSTLHPNLVRWLACYIRGRTASCKYLSATAPKRIIRSGVPQGAVLSPSLFNFFLQDCPVTPSIMTSYADDVTIAESFPDISPDVTTLTNRLNDVLGPISDWATTNKLTIAPTKSSVTLFTPWSKQFNSHPQVSINNSIIPLDKNPKILGVTFDPMFTFGPHIKNITTKTSKRLNIIKALAGTTWGHQKETLSLTYKSLIKPIITYAAPVWHPHISSTNLKSLQIIQNKALRAITGNLLMADIPHLHSETQTLPIKNHLDLLCTQFLANALHPDHPSHPYVTLNPGPRHDRRIKTLQSTYADKLTDWTTDGTISSDDRKVILKDLHTEAVTTYLHDAPPNRVLGGPPPDIDPSERTLSRHHRTTLAQLRSGHCSRLRTYQQRIGIGDSDSCPECDSAPHTVHHIFDCPAHPTQLTTEDLWRSPLQVATFLSEMSAFEGLPEIPPDPPAPPPPPEPPPREARTSTS